MREETPSILGSLSLIYTIKLYL